MTIKYSDLIARWMREDGHVLCYSLGGGNIMHMVESVSREIRLVPVVHEVAAGIAAEYFNEVSDGSRRAFALVTTGPGLTNIVTALAGAFTESRELVVIGGQVKTADLCHANIRQRGIQEVDGTALVAPVCKRSVRLCHPIPRHEFLDLVRLARTGRKGPVFIEIPLDIQGRMVDSTALEPDCPSIGSVVPRAGMAVVEQVAGMIRQAQRPVLLLGGGLDRQTCRTLGDAGFLRLGVPVLTTYNGADRLGSEHPLYFGRPNTWGQRSSNLIIQQADLVVALGTRLGLQQTGFNWQGFVPLGRIVQVDLDAAELAKGHPRIHLGIPADANAFLRDLAGSSLGDHQEWIGLCRQIRQALPIDEGPVNVTGPGFISPYAFFLTLSDLCAPGDLVIPCSSGGAFTCAYQSILQKGGQIMVSDKSLASMGYGLSGAIGAAMAHPDRRTVLVEGDGGFAQTLQELGTAAINRVNVKIFLFDDQGYASIRMTQRSYFKGRYVGCDVQTGLGLPDWDRLFPAFGLPTLRLRPGWASDPSFRQLFNAPGLAAFIVSVDPEQTYFPKITSRTRPDGGMESNPLHRMTPDLSTETYARLAPHLAAAGL